MSNFPTLVISATQTINASRPLINTYITSSKTAIDNHVSGTADKHDAAFITYSSSITSAITVESAIDTTYVRMNDHVTGTAEKHDAGDILYTGSITAATTVESAIETVDTRISAHVTGTAEKHAAGDITYSGILTAATTVLSAIQTGYDLLLDHASGGSNRHDSTTIDYSSAVTSANTVESAIDTLYGLVQSINSSGSTVEVVEARTAMNGEIYAALKNHLWSIENMAGQVTTKTSDTTLLTTERGIINVTNASANITLTLPSSATTQISFDVKKSFTASFTVSIIATGSQTIGGTTALKTLINSEDRLKILSDGSNWLDIGGDLHLNFQVANIRRKFRMEAF